MATRLVAFIYFSHLVVQYTIITGGGDPTLPLIDELGVQRPCVLRLRRRHS